MKKKRVNKIHRFTQCDRYKKGAKELLEWAVTLVLITIGVSGWIYIFMAPPK
jgi:cytochrome b subunit of formate dehydrogenase